MDQSVNPHRSKDASLFALANSFFVNRSLIFQLTKREVIGRYRGSVMGLAWSFFNPLLMLAVYTFFFSVVFKARWGGDGSNRAEFAVFLFVGILVHAIFAECVNRAPTLILGNANYVKRVIFPLEVFPWVAMGSALFHAVISLVVLLGVQLALGHRVTATSLYFPLVILPLVIMTMGAAWLLAAVGVYMRDIGHFTVILTTVLLFMSPVFYPISAMPEPYRSWMVINPLTFIIEQSRGILLLDTPPDWSGLAWYSLAGILSAWMGFWAFQKMRRGFSDVL
jgi:lipopolysaccharide transport system permease protein